MGLLAIASALIMVASLPPAQQQAPEQSATLPTADSTDDIIISALRIPREKLPVQVHWSYPTIYESTIARDGVEKFTRCAFGKAKTSLIRDAVEGPPNYASTRFAATWISETNNGCYRPRPINDKPYVRSGAIDRGVLIQLALDRYAADAELDEAQTYDPDIVRRLKKNEQSRNRYRLANDLDAFKLSLCLVQRQPKIATRLVHAASGSKLEQGLSQALMIDGRDCLGKVRRLSVDPTFLKLYVSEAFYRWIVATRNVASLIPDD